MEKIKKIFSLIIMMIFLCQNVSFGIQERSSALRPPSHFSRSTEEFTESQYEKERIKTYIEELLKEKEGCIYEAANHSYEIVTPDARISLREFLEGEIGKKFSGYSINFPEKAEFEKTGIRNLKVNLYDSGGGLSDTFVISLFVNHIPFGKFVGNFNKLYYAIKGGQITITPETATAVSHDSTTAEANAIEFYEHLKSLNRAGKLPETIVVQGWAVGNGAFDKDFIRKFLELDKMNDKNYGRRLKYVLVDFSEQALKRVRTELYEYESIIDIETIVQDLSKEIGIYRGKTHYIRFNELYDDLPGALIISKEKGKYYQWFVEPNFNIPNEILLKNGRTISRDEFIIKYFYRENFEDADLLPDNILKGIGLNTWVKREMNLDGRKYGSIIKGYCEETDIFKLADQVILNMGALENLISSSVLLDTDGYVQFYDYGVMKESVAGYRLNHNWGQPTCDVDFAFLNYALQQLGFKNIVTEKQSGYLSRILGQKVIPRRYVVATSRDNYEGAAPVSLKLIPGLEEIKNKKNLRKILHKHLKDYELEELFKKSIAQELLLLWQDATNKGKPWVLENQVRSIPLVGYLTDIGKNQLIENLSNPEIRSKFPYNTKNVYYHFEVGSSSVDLSLIKRRLEKSRETYVDL